VSPERKTVLVLARQVGESIMIGDSVEVCVNEIRNGNHVRLAILAPRDVVIMRKELNRDE